MGNRFRGKYFCASCASDSTKLGPIPGSMAMQQTSTLPIFGEADRFLSAKQCRRCDRDNRI